MLLSSAVSLTPITTIIACNKKDETTDEGSRLDKNNELFNMIKSEISSAMDSSATKIYLDAKDLKLDNEEVKKILNPIFEAAQKNEEIFVNDNTIINKITEKVKNIINDLNVKLKRIPILENIDNAITLYSLKARMNGNDIKTLIDLIDAKSLFFASENNSFDYNLQLNLNFKINVQSKEDSYTYNPKSAFITSNKKDLDDKISNLADKLSEKLVNQDLNGKNIIDNVLNNKAKSYIESFSNELNKEFQDKSIIIKKSANMEINREQLSFQLKNITNDLSYLNKFSNFINENTSANTTEQMFNERSKDGEFYQFNNYKDKIIGDKIYIKDFSEFAITDWTIEGIELPNRILKNIRIYQEISNIKISWKNFYEILRYYLDLKHRYNNHNDAFRILDYRYSSDIELKMQTGQKRIEQWIESIKKEISNKQLNLLNAFTFSVNAGGWGTKIFDTPPYGTQINIFNTIIQLFSNELSFQLVKNKSVYFYYKK